MDGAEASYTGHSRCSGSLMVALQGGQPVSAVSVEPVDLCREGSPCVAQHTSVGHPIDTSTYDRYKYSYIRMESYWSVHG